MVKTVVTSQHGYAGAGLLPFLAELRRHNERTWFEKNKARYESDVRDAVLTLIAELGPGLKKISPHFVADPSPTGGSMMRIYRDIRFSKDKSPYKTAMAAHFWHAKGKEGMTPAFYLRLEPANSMIGGGIWRPEPPALKKIRDKIVAEPQQWRRATSEAAFGSGCGMGGESLKRPPPGYDPNHPLIADIKRKDFVISLSIEDVWVARAEFAEHVLERLREATPFMKFLTEAVGLPF